MRIAYLDTIAGIAGDMTLGGFVSAGVSIDVLINELKKLPLGGFELQARHVHRHSISAVRIEVVVPHEPHVHRNPREIRSIIEDSSLSRLVKDRAHAVFGVIAEAEAKIHGTSVEEVHFHEVGALDSIVDIAGVAVCLEQLRIERVYTSPVRLGSGSTVKTRHGSMPVPTPASLEILKDYPISLTSVPHELTTPTGAGIVKALSSGTLDEDILIPEAVGYGAGTLELEGLPNILRVVVAELPAMMDRDEVVVVETNIDDMNPQIYPYLIDKLLASGAHDAYLIPVIMKKGRPGVLLSVMADRSKLDTIVHLIYLHTSTIGVRVQSIGRKKLPRRLLEVQTSLGRVTVKAVTRDGVEYFAPEFEECRRIAEERGIPLPEVIRTIEQELRGR